MSLEYRAFKGKYLGKSINYDNFAGAQCMDVYRQYAKELGFPQSPPVTGAKDIWDSYLPEYWEKIENTPTGVPQEGDVIIWGSGVGQYGHVAIFDRGTATAFYSIDQNWPNDGGTGVLKEVKHNYANVLGWLRPKLPVNEEMTEEEKRILQFLKEQGAGEGKVREAFGALIDQPEKDKQIQTLQARVLDLEKSQKDLEDRITALESNIQADLDLIKDWQKQAETAKKQLDNANKENQKLIKEKNDFKGLYEKKCKETVDKLSWQDLISELVNRFKTTWLRKSK